MPADLLPEQFDSAESYLFGAMVTNSQRVIVYANSYFSSELNWSLDQLIGSNADKLLTRSSIIFYESYLVPILTHERQCEELQLAIIDGDGKRIPVIVNTRKYPNGMIYWSFFNASKRDKLYDELVAARNKLEEQSEALRLLSSVDDLTGLLNRREMDKLASLCLLQAKRKKAPITLVLLDIDYFKKVNDRYGHQEGDRVLKELGSLLNLLKRESDLAARYGGEEFLMMLPDTKLEHLALYQSKSKGRNRTEVFSKHIQS
jgi:GGDEF domain-containing protein